MSRVTIVVCVLAIAIVAALGSGSSARARTTADSTGKIVSGSNPSTGGFGLIVYGGGSFDQLVAASGCSAARVAFWFTVNGTFVVLIPGTTNTAANAGAQAAFPDSAIPANTALIGRCLPAAQFQVTLADDGGTLMLRVGETFLLNLGDTYSWSAQVADTSVVSRIVNVTVIDEAQGIYRATGIGTTTLTATGGLNCPPGTACPAIARLFRITLIVQ